MSFELETIEESTGASERTIAILGLGLIGGSIGLALKASASAPTIVGWDHDPAASAEALARGAIDRVVTEATEAVAAAEIVLVAVPVVAVRQVFEAIRPALRTEAVVTDVASTKVEVCGWAAELLPGRFVGGHPMAGSERAGVANASANLFSGATYCLTPEPGTPPEAVEVVSELAQRLGARVLLLSPTAHDRAVAAISHLPFLLSTVLIDVTTTSPEWEVLRSVAATGYRDVSRLASGDPEMHRDICLTNAAEIRPWLLRAAGALQALAEELENGTAMLRRFEDAKAARDAFIDGLGMQQSPSTTRR